MSDHSEPPSAELSELLVAVLEQAEEIGSLDASRAEAWASDVLALVAESGHEPAALFGALASDGGDRGATALTALAGVHDEVPQPVWVGPPPEWVGAVGTSRCEGAWRLRGGGGESIAFRFVDADEARHVITVDLLEGSPETVGEVVVGPGDLLDALQEDDADIDSEDAGAPHLAGRCVEALGATQRPSLSAVINGRLLLRRLADLTPIAIAPPVFVDDEIPEPPERDPDDDAYALDVLARALGEGIPNDAAGVHALAVAAVSDLVAPADLSPLEPAQRDAVLILEWADWLGAVIGLVRAGEGTLVDGSVIVDLVNRCPEVTTTIPKADRHRIEWAFDTLIEPWSDLGVLADGHLTPLGVDVLPAALRRAWSSNQA